MADIEDRKSSAQSHPTHEDENVKEKAGARCPKKKKVRRHRVHKGASLGKKEEDTDDEGDRRSLSSRERKQQPPNDVDIEDIPTMNYISDDKKAAAVIQSDPESPEERVEGEKEEEVEEEEVVEEEQGMTQEEKQALYAAACTGDIDKLEDCLDKPNSDINMIWFQENLLVAALKSEQEEMAEFLIDNGVNYNFNTVMISVTDERSRKMEWFECSCRQLAFDKGLHDVVELIDYLNGDLFKFVKPKPRIPRYRRPKPPTPVPSRGESENDASSEASKDRSDDESDGRQKKKKKKKRKDSREEDGGNDDRETRKEKKITGRECDEDSGNHSDSDDKRADGEGSKSRGNSSKGRTGSSRCSTSKTSTTDRSASPPVIRSETFMKKFMFLSCPSDEGYASLSPKSSPVSTESKQKRVAITIPPRGTKSSLGMRQASLIRKAKAEQSDELPTTQRKVQTPGSYESESFKWHRKVDRNLNKNSNAKSMCDADISSAKKSENVPKRVDANYMKMTASAFTKRKLEPNFRKSYSSLEFVTDKVIQHKQDSGNKRTVYTRQTVSFMDLSPKDNGNRLNTSRSSNKWKAQPVAPKYQRTITRVF